MIRIRTGERWKSDRSLSQAALVEEAHDAIGIEVDGVEISGGVLEDLLFPTAAALVEEITSLVDGSARTAAVPFAEGRIELLLARHGGSVALSLVSLARPARVLVRDLEVELEPLAAAARSCAEELLGALAQLSPKASDAALARRLATATKRLRSAAARPGEGPLPGPPVRVRSRPAARGTQVPTFGFDLHDEDGRLSTYESGAGLHALLAPGHLYLHGSDGEELCAAAGSPFLLLRDLSEGAFRLLCALRDGESLGSLPVGGGAPVLEVDLAGGAFTVAGRTLRCPADALARAAFEGALDLAGALQARNPLLAVNPYLQSLAEEARERLSLCRELAGGHLAAAEAPSPPRTPAGPEGGPPLAPGTLRRVAFRAAWRLSFPPVRELLPSGSRAWLLGDEGAACVRLADGVIVARLAATGRLHLSTAGPRAPLLVLTGDGRLAGHSPSGKLRWFHAPSPAQDISPGYAEVPLPAGGSVGALVVDGRVLLGIALQTGRCVFRLVPPAAVRAQVAVAGKLAVLAADNGILYGIDATNGSLAWRLRVGLTPSHVTIASGLAIAVADGKDGPVLFGAAAVSGEPVFRVGLELGAVGAVLPISGGVIVAGVGASGGEVLKVDGSGKIRSRLRPILGPTAPALLRAGGALYARGSEGICRIDRGKVRWSAPCGPGAAPVLSRGVLALPGERLQLLDAATARDLLAGGAADELPAADRVLGTPGGLFAICDREGSCAGVRLTGALAVV